MPDATCACPGCDAPLPPPSGGPARLYCSRRCGSRADYLRRRATIAQTKKAARDERRQRAKSCPQCLTEFVPAQTIAQKFCSRRCMSNFNRDRADKPQCATDRCDRPVRAKGLCGTHYNSTYFPDSRERWPESPEAKARRLRKSTSMRRARIRNANREPVDRNVVAERDGWKCGICETAVDPALSYPDPLSASLDHIEPLSLGGDHTYANARLAHLTCNVRRSNRVA